MHNCRYHHIRVSHCGKHSRVQTDRIFEFIFGTKWNPDTTDGLTGAVNGNYGVFKMIVGTIVGTLGALLVGGVLGFFTAVFISRFCPKK